MMAKRVRLELTHELPRYYQFSKLAPYLYAYLSILLSLRFIELRLSALLTSPPALNSKSSYYFSLIATSSLWKIKSSISMALPSFSCLILHGL